MELTREDQITLQKHKLGICDDLREIQATLLSFQYDAVLNFVHKNLKELQHFQTKLNNKQANEVFEAWTEEKKTILLRMQEKLKPKKIIKRKRENDDKENLPNKKRYFESGIDALLAAAAELEANGNKHNTSDWSETESHLDLSTEAIDLTKAIKQVASATTKPIDLSHPFAMRQVPVRRAVFAVNGCLFGNPRKPVLWKRTTNSAQQQQQQQIKHVYQQDETSCESSKDDSNFSEAQTSIEAFDNTTTTEIQRQLTHSIPLSHSTPHASAKRSAITTKHMQQGEDKIKAFKPTLAVTPQKIDETACHIKTLRAATLMHININNAVVEEEVTTNQTPQHAAKVEDIKIEDYMLIGPNGTIIPKHQYDKINWRTPSAATRSLLLALFTEEYLASHCLSGKPSPAFIGRERPAKAQLDPAKIQDIIHCVVNQMSCSDREVKQTITTQCADTAKKMRKRKCGDQKKIERN